MNKSQPLGVIPGQVRRVLTRQPSIVRVQTTKKQVVIHSQRLGKAINPTVEQL